MTEKLTRVICKFCKFTFIRERAKKGKIGIKDCYICPRCRGTYHHILPEQDA